MGVGSEPAEPETQADAAAEPAGPDLRERNVLLLDLSKSMLAPLPEPDGVSRERQKIEVARTAVYRILQDAAKSGTPFGLVTFTETVRVPVPLGEIHRDHLPFIENLISLLSPSGRSAIWDALGAGGDLLRSGERGVRGNLVLVTDGWDNASARYTSRPVPDDTQEPAKVDLVPHLLPPNSQLSVRILGIGAGDERDKGVDAAQMHDLLERLRSRSAEIGGGGVFTFQEVTTGSALFAQMVQAFLDVGYGDDHPAVDELHPEELAKTAAAAARALKDPGTHGTVTKLHVNPSGPSSPSAPLVSPAVEVGVLPTAGGAPAYLKDRYGPLGEIVETYLAGRYDQASAMLVRAAAVLPPVSRWYWEARIRFAQKQPTEAARALLEAWNAAEKLPDESRVQVVRRLALLQAKLQDDRETETLVQFLDDAEHRLEGTRPAIRERLRGLLGEMMELRGTYQLTRLAGAGDLQDAALKHEQAVEQVFGKLQDARLELAGTGPVVDSTLDFIEICLAEMR
ncbi:MAG TPA: vWA domain-containing protein [Thermoplasmata archaeon]|nr:vWA domain-containing protein [Thermoplasmata archaeon]